jgi:hypothetical protein
VFGATFLELRGEVVCITPFAPLSLLNALRPWPAMMSS